MKQLLIALVVAGASAVSGCREADRGRWDEFWRIDGGAAGGRQGDGTEIWTIECNEYLGAGRAEMADKMATALKRVSRLRADQVWAEHKSDRSRVFYGEYTLKYERAQVDSESRAAGDFTIKLSEAIRRDLKFIRSLAVGQNQKFPFFSARAIPKPEEDVGSPEWDLCNTRGHYTLKVGVTYNTPTLHSYKQAAIQWVSALREDGYEAYYYHDPVRAQTAICVGVFGPDAMTKGADGKPHYSEAVERLRRTNSFQYCLENGHKIVRTVTTGTGKHVKVANLSFLMKIPKRGEQGAP